MTSVLVICTGNAVRSILAETALRHEAGDRMRVYSAGTNPVGSVHPEVIALLSRRGMASAGLRSKSWHEFRGPGAPRLGLIVSLCSAATAEIEADWPEAPRLLRWHIDDPLCAPLDQRALAVQITFDRIRGKARDFISAALDDRPFALLSGRPSP